VAQDVVDAWLRVLDPKTGAPYAYLLGDNIEGADAFLKGQGPAANVKIAAPDPRTFVVTFVGPLPYALAMLAHNAFMVTPSFAVKRFGPGQWTKPAHFIGNGPYVLKTWRPQDQIVVVKNPRYWDAANIRLHSITYLTIEDPNVAFDKYLAGEIDYVTDDSIPVGRIDEIRLRKDYHHQPSSSIYYYIFNLAKKPFDDVRVRKALSMAVDRRMSWCAGCSRPGTWPPAASCRPWPVSAPPGATASTRTRPAGCWPRPATPAARASPPSPSPTTPAPGTS
jgi:oligopeptide transport system substrate-binding protein